LYNFKGVIIRREMMDFEALRVGLILALGDMVGKGV
jgi:hypothetical protein